LSPQAFSYSQQERTEIYRLLERAGIDKEDQDTALGEIQDAVNIYLKIYTWSKSLPGPKKRKEQIEEALKNQAKAPHWITDFIAFGERTEILNTLLKCSTLKRGPQKDYAFEYLLSSLADIFCQFTGRERPITWNPYEGQYEGDLIELAIACLAPLGANHSKSRYALGQAFRRIFEDQQKK